jgi:hypothetical protein
LRHARRDLTVFLAYGGVGGLGANNFGFDDEIVGAAQHDQMFDIVATNNHQLSLAVEIESVDQPQARLPPAGLSGHPQPPGRKYSINQEEKDKGDDSR